jgi:hypothetical protein
VLPSGAILMRPNDFKLTAISGSKCHCHTIQTIFNVEKDFLLRKYPNIILQISMLHNFQCYSFLSVTIKQLLEHG